MEIVDRYFAAIFSEKPGKDSGWFQTFKKYKFSQMKLLENEMHEKKKFLDETSQVSCLNL